MNTVKTIKFKSLIIIFTFCRFQTYLFLSCEQTKEYTSNIFNAIFKQYSVLQFNKCQTLITILVSEILNLLAYIANLHQPIHTAK